MDESSLRAQLARLEASRSSLHSSFRRWEWIVVAGIVLELLVLIKEYWDGWRAYHRATIRLPEKPSTLLFGLGVLGVTMVAGGISKELGIDSQIEKVETQIRGVNEQLFGIVSKEAESASTKSQLAQDKSGEAVASSKYALGLANKTTAIEEARLPRRLSNRDTSEIGHDLEVFVGQGIYLTFPQDDDEAFDFMEDITSAVRKAKWSMLGSRSQIVTLESGPEPSPTKPVPIPPPLRGVFVVYKPAAPDRKPVTTLACELSSRGFDVVLDPNTSNLLASFNPSDIVVQVGHRPKGLQGDAKLKHEKKSKKQIKCQ